MTPTKPDEVVIGLDVGTSATKAVAFAPGGWTRAASRDYPLLTPGPGRHEQDPATVADAVLDALADLVDGLDATPVRAVAVSAAMHGVLGLDEHSAPVTPLVTWADGRAVDDARVLAAERPELHRITGTPLHPMAPLATIRWFGRERPATVDRVRWWVGLKDWVLLTLTGRLLTEPSSASGTGLYDLGAEAWHAGAAAAAGTTVDHLPEVVAVDTRLDLAPEAASRTGLPAGLPVVAGAADGPLGNLGVGAVGPGVVGLSLGTSGAARVVLPGPPPRLDAGLFHYLLADDLHVVGGAVSTGGLVADWAAEALAPDLPDTSPPRVQRLLALAAEVAPGSDGVVMLPHLLPPRAPDFHPDLAGTWLGVRPRHDRRHLARAAIEGVALGLAEVVARLGDLGDVVGVRATGGALRDPLWRGALAAALGRSITVVGATAGTALGAAALGWWALREAPDPLAARAALAGPGDDRVVTPDPDGVAALVTTRSHRVALLAALAESASGAGSPPDARSVPAGEFVDRDHGLG